MERKYSEDNYQLFESLLKLESVDECRKFLEDLCTIKEIDSMSQRLKAASLLIDGETYEQVIEKTGISSATLSRVSKCIRYGDGGYRDVIEKARKKGQVKKS